MSQAGGGASASAILRRVWTRVGLAGVALAVLLLVAFTVSRFPQRSGEGAAPTAPAAMPGVRVCEVAPDGPAARAGVQRDDRLVRVGESPLSSYDDLAAALRGYRPGQQARLTVLHDGAERSLAATLGERDDRAYLGLSGCPPD